MTEKKLKNLKIQLEKKKKSCFLNYPNSDQNAKMGFGVGEISKKGN
jgi:hypothetical protein